MKIKRLKDYKITRLIFLIFAIFQFCNLAIYSQPKDGYVLNVEIGSTTTLTWKVPGDYTGYDSLYFAVKACTTSSACGRLVGPSKSCSVAYQKPYTTVTCSLFAANTAGFNSAKYFWSIYAYGADTVAVRSGVLNLQLNGQTDVDGIATNYPVHLFAIDSSDQEPGVLIGRNSNNTTDWWSLQTLRDSLQLDSSAVEANFDSLYAKTSHIVKIEEYIGALDTSLGWSFVVQAAVDANLGTGNTLMFDGNKVYELQRQKDNPYEGGTSDCAIDLGTGGISLIIPPTTVLKLKADQQTDATGAIDIVVFGTTASDIHIGGGGEINGNTENQPNWTSGYSQGGAYGAIIEGFAVSHNTITNQRVTIENLRLNNHFACPVNITGVENITLRDLSSYGTGEGFQLQWCKYIYADNILVSDSTGVSVGDGFELASCDYFIVKGCVIVDNDDLAGTAVDLFGSQHGTFTDFIIDNWASGAMSIDNGVGNRPTFDVAISNGIVKNINPSTTAINITTTGSNTFSNIYIDSCGIAIQINDTLATVAYLDNITVENSSTGIILTGDNTIYLKNSVFNGCGLYIGKAVGDNEPPELYITNNTFKDMTTAIALNNGGDTAWLPTGVIQDNIFQNVTNKYSFSPLAVADSVIINGGNNIDMEEKNYFNFGKINIVNFQADTTGLNSGDLYIDANTGIVYSVLGASFILNGTFDTWVGEELKTRSPTYWSITVVDTNNAYLVNNSSRLEFISDGDEAIWSVYANTSYIPEAVLGDDYGYSFDVISWSGDSVRVDVAGVMVNTDYAVLSAGSYRGRVTATHIRPFSLFSNTQACDVIIDNVKVWKIEGGDLQAPVYIHNLPYVNNFLNPTTDDTLSLFLTDKSFQIDSITLRVDDSVGVKLTYGGLGLGTTILESDTLVSGWQTITSFDDNTVEADNEVYLYFTYIGDTATFIRWKIYWRD